MPCFHGLAVSIHTTGAGGGPLPEYGIQKQTRVHRITTYVPVPTPKLQPGTNKPEPATFAISITLLTPGLNVPYSTPNPTPDDPHPRPKIVGGHSDTSTYRGKFGATIAPYTPLTQSPNETIAAYIYFDGRPKEEVATLLRRGEETWVNSRWVSVPEAEGGGLAEKEFIFREVGLERWLNGLDLEGNDAKDAAAKIEKRRQRFERKRRIKKELDSDDEDDADGPKKSKPYDRDRNGVLRYGEDKNAPVESLSDDDDSAQSEVYNSEDDAPMPEAAGQIKVALFRVLASGEVKRGEYSPQFDVHDDEEQMNAAENDAEIDHTTSFAKPKTLDPKSISTQTVTGIDPPEKPYAVFTFLYRGSRQLQKMGILPSPPQPTKTPTSVKRKSAQIDFGNLAPLSSSAAGTKNFAGYRDTASTPKRKSGRKSDEDAMDSDAEDDDDNDQTTTQDDDDKEDLASRLLSPEDALQEAKLSEDVRKIRLKRQLSTEPLSVPSPKEQDRKASPGATTPTSTDSPANALSGSENGTAADPKRGQTASAIPADIGEEASIGSPFKKQRSSLPGFDESMRKKLGLDATGSGPRRESESAIASAFASGAGTAWPSIAVEGQSTFEPGPELKKEEIMEEEL